MPQMACNIAKPRLPKTPTCMKYMGIQFLIKTNRNEDTGDFQKRNESDKKKLRHHLQFL